MPSQVIDQKSPMRVLHYMFFPGGGIGRYIHELCSAQAEVGSVDLRLVCNPDFVYQSDARYPIDPSLFSLDSRIPAVRRGRFLAGQWISPKRFLKRVRSEQADVVHFSNINHLSYAFWRKELKKTGVKVCCTAHDVRRASKIINRKWEDRWLAQFYLDCDAVFVHSDTQKNDLLDFAAVEPHRVDIVPHGIYEYPVSVISQEQLLAKYDIPPDRPIGLFFGFVREDKNLPNLLSALAECRERPYLVVAGKIASSAKWNEAEYRKLVDKLRLENDVRFIARHISDAGVGELFKIADFVPMTYRESFSSQSGVLNVAAFYQKPILVTPAPTMAETVRSFEIGEVCDSDQPQDIQVGLQRICARLGEDWQPAFKHYHREHSWETAARKSIEVYRTVVAESEERRAKSEERRQSDV